MPAPLCLIRNAEAFAPEPLGRCHVLVGGGRILSITSEEPEVSGVDVEVVDAYGARLIPGLIDGHVHVTGGGGEAGPHTAAPASGLSVYTRAGVTSVVGLLGTDDTTRTTGGLLRQVRALREEGLSAWAWTGGYHLPPTTLTGAVRSDIAFVREIIGFAELALSDHRSSQPTADEVARVAADCHLGGLMTGKAGVLHLHMGDGRRGLELLRDLIARTEIPPRTFHPTHVNRRRALFEEAIAITGDGVTVDVTAFPPEPSTGTGPDDEIGAAEALEAAWAAGVPPERLTVSSDGGGALPVFDRQGQLLRMGFATSGALADLLAELLGRGHAPERVLPPFTSAPADLLRLRGKGRLGVGHDADLVLLAHDGRPERVMARGRWHVVGGRAVVTGLFDLPPDLP